MLAAVAEHHQENIPEEETDAAGATVAAEAAAEQRQENIPNPPKKKRGRPPKAGQGKVPCIHKGCTNEYKNHRGLWRHLNTVVNKCYPCPPGSNCTETVCIRVGDKRSFDQAFGPELRERRGKRK